METITKITLVSLLSLSMMPKKLSCMFFEKIPDPILETEESHSHEIRKSSLTLTFDLVRKKKEKIIPTIKKSVEKIEGEKREIKKIIGRINNKSEILDRESGRSESEKSIEALKEYYLFYSFSEKIKCIRMNSKILKTQIEEILEKDTESLARDKSSAINAENQLIDMYKELERINTTLEKIIIPFLSFKDKLEWAEELIDEEIRKIETERATSS